MGTSGVCGAAGARGSMRRERVRAWIRISKGLWMFEVMMSRPWLCQILGQFLHAAGSHLPINLNNIKPFYIMLITVFAKAKARFRVAAMRKNLEDAAKLSLYGKDLSRPPMSTSPACCLMSGSSGILVVRLHLAHG
jgi:hypothetical protein